MTDNMPQFTVLLPVHRPPNLLPFAIDSVLAQTEQRFELFVVCDGAPRETVAYARAVAERERRLHVFAFEKGARYGETHRHTALMAARSRFVAQIGDDDLWFPDHLAELASLLDNVDFGSLLQVDLAPDGALHVHMGDLSDPDIRRRMCQSPSNYFGPSCAGYRLSAYRSLPQGWSPAPEDVWTDLHMWRKFLQAPGLSYGTRFAIQSLKISAATRTSMSIDEREAEHRLLAARFARPEERSNLQARAFRALCHRLEDARKQALGTWHTQQLGS
ncbi:MAG: glycosyltransferase family 2 protein [Alphaproteobacteria bacterium]|nr:glycosyltransferase family 2 protein [Alphaproteobacteria bacterium]